MRLIIGSVGTIMLTLAAGLVLVQSLEVGSLGLGVVSIVLELGALAVIHEAVR